MGIAQQYLKLISTQVSRCLTFLPSFSNSSSDLATARRGFKMFVCFFKIKGLERQNYALILLKRKPQLAFAQVYFGSSLRLAFKMWRRLWQLKQHLMVSFRSSPHVPVKMLLQLMCHLQTPVKWEKQWKTANFSLNVHFRLWILDLQNAKIPSRTLASVVKNDSDSCAA